MDLQWYVLVLLVKKFNVLEYDHKIDFLQLFLNQKKPKLAIITLLSFLDITSIDQKNIRQYIISKYNILYEAFRSSSLVKAASGNNLLEIKTITPEQLTVMAEIEQNLTNNTLWDLDNFFIKQLSSNNKASLPTLLNHYDPLSMFQSAPLALAAARGDISLITTIGQTTTYGLTAIHWAIIGNPKNIIEVLNFLLPDEEIKLLSFEYLQLMLRLAINWSDTNFVNYLLDRFQNNISYNIFIELINKGYKSRFQWDTLNTPLVHAIKSADKYTVDTLTLLLINYGANLNVLQRLKPSQTCDSDLIKQLLTSDIPSVVKKLGIIKDENMDHPYTLENIKDACSQSPKLPVLFKTNNLDIVSTGLAIGITVIGIWLGYKLITIKQNNYQKQNIINIATYDVSF